MAYSDTYRKQVQLLIQTLPHVAGEDCFALKGGTAILSAHRRPACIAFSYRCGAETNCRAHSAI
jgi:hypothetical protein